MNHRGSNTRDLLILDSLTGPCYMDLLACPASFLNPCEVPGYPEDSLSAAGSQSQFLLPATIEPDALASPSISPVILAKKFSSRQKVQDTCHFGLCHVSFTHVAFV
jgi:hypothetical protein